MSKKLVLSIAVAALAAGLLTAQSPGDGPRLKGKGKMPPSGMLPGPGGILEGPNAEQRLTRVLGLNAEQQNKVHTALEERKVLTQGQAGKMDDLRTQLSAAVKAGEDSKIDQITQDMARLQQQQTAIQAKTMSKVYGALNVDQRARLDASLDRQLGVRPRRSPAVTPAPGAVQ